MSKAFHGLPQFPEPVLLHRIDPARNMRRFYRLDVLPDLFGGVLLVKHWGRIGSRGQCQTRRFEDAAAANIAMRAQARRKERRGYAAQAE
jgi:predicted DNA-binding WGR domain protein